MLWISPDDDAQPYGYWRVRLVDTQETLKVPPEETFPYAILEEQPGPPTSNGRMVIAFNRGAIQWSILVPNDTARSHMRHLVEAANTMAGIWASVEYRRHPTLPKAGEFIARMPYTHRWDRGSRKVVAHGKSLSELFRNLADEIERTGQDITPESAEVVVA